MRGYGGYENIYIINFCFLAVTFLAVLAIGLGIRLIGSFSFGPFRKVLHSRR